MEASKVDDRNEDEDEDGNHGGGSRLLLVQRGVRCLITSPLRSQGKKLYTYSSAGRGHTPNIRLAKQLRTFVAGTHE